MTHPSCLSDDEITQYSSEYQLPREQIIDYVAEFKAYDLTSDGKISANDLAGINKAFGENVSEEVLQEWIKMTDVRGDNQVSLHEFLQLKSNEAQWEDKKIVDAM